jgi:hypothetical protein
MQNLHIRRKNTGMGIWTGAKTRELTFRISGSIGRKATPGFGQDSGGNGGQRKNCEGKSFHIV